MVDKCILGVEPGQPFFALVCKLLGKRKFNRLVVFIVNVFKLDSVSRYRREILLGFLCCRGTKTFVVFYLEILWVGLLCNPFFVFRQCEECPDLLHTLAYLDNWSHEFFEEARDLEERRPKEVDEVNDQTLDVTAIVVLISHDHYRSVP